MKIGPLELLQLAAAECYIDIRLCDGIYHVTLEGKSGREVVATNENLGPAILEACQSAGLVKVCQPDKNGIAMMTPTTELPLV